MINLRRQNGIDQELGMTIQDSDHIIVQVRELEQQNSTLLGARRPLQKFDATVT